jgi:hypothetical protein
MKQRAAQNHFTKDVQFTSLHYTPHFIEQVHGCPNGVLPRYRHHKKISSRGP